jgi:hypothetical protein
MTINELVKKGLLKEVEVQRPSDAVVEAGNQISAVVFKNLGLNCADNSTCVVEAMREQGENDWHIVPGFAFNIEGEGPIAHVWVRKGLLHYDPTWILRNWNPEDLAYYQVLQSLGVVPREWEKDALQRIIKCGNDILRGLKDLAAEWELKLSGQLD